MDWLDSDYSKSLFDAIGLTKDDFIGLRGISESEFTGRVVVWCQEGLSGPNKKALSAKNLFRAVHTDDGYVEYFFDRIAKQEDYW